MEAFAALLARLRRRLALLPDLKEEAREGRQSRALAAFSEPEPSADEDALARRLLDGVLQELDADGGVLSLRNRHGKVTAEARAGASSDGTLVVTPLIEGEEVVGTLQLVSGRSSAFWRNDERFLEALAGRLARQIVLARTRLELASAYAIRHGALEASRTGVCVYGEDGARFWNSAFVELLGRDPRSPLPPPEQLPAVGEELRVRTKGGRALRLRLSRIDDADLLLSVDDLTDEMREQETRARFVAEVVAAQDREARRIAELLHDDAVQQLTALGMRLELEARRSGGEALPQLAADASTITASLRRVLVQLHPAVLESRGIAAAIDAVADSLRARGLEVDVAPFEQRLPAEVENLAYRVVQEALSNIVKHAEARRVEVELHLAGSSLRCQVRDDGRGLDPERVRTALRRGLVGLQLVRDRVELAGGRFLIESSPGGGSVFAFDLPVPATAATEHVRAS